MHLPHIVKQIAKTYRIRLTAKLIFIGSHGPSRPSLYPIPIQWEADTLPSSNAVHVCQQDSNTGQHFSANVKSFFTIKTVARLHPPS